MFIDIYSPRAAPGLTVSGAAHGAHSVVCSPQDRIRNPHLDGVCVSGRWTVRKCYNQRPVKASRCAITLRHDNHLCETQCRHSGSTYWFSGNFDGLSDQIASQIKVEQFVTVVHKLVALICPHYVALVFWCANSVTSHVNSHFLLVTSQKVIHRREH